MPMTASTDFLSALGRKRRTSAPALLAARYMRPPRVSRRARLIFGIFSAALDTAQGGAGFSLRGHHFDLRADGGRQLAAGNGFGQKIANPETHAFRARLNVVTCADKNDRNLGGRRVFLQYLTDLKTVHVGHHQVEQDDVDFLLAHLAQTFVPRIRLDWIE